MRSHIREHKLHLNDVLLRGDVFFLWLLGCGSEDHLAKDYDQKQAEPERKQNEQEKSSDKSVKVSGIQNAGLFVSAFVNN